MPSVYKVLTHLLFRSFKYHNHWTIYKGNHLVEFVLSVRGRGRSRSTNFGRGAGSLSGDRYSDRYSLDRLELASNISEPSGTPPLPSGEVVYVCPVCGQVQLFFFFNCSTTFLFFWSQFHQHFMGPFFKQSVLRSFSIIVAWLCNFLAQEYWRKSWS